MQAPDSTPWTDADEEYALLEISEDRRLRRLGIDPDDDPLSILVELKKRLTRIDAERALRQNGET